MMIERALRYVGYGWIAIVALYGVWLGFRQMFFNEPGLIFTSGIGDIYVLALIASPGIGLVALSGKLAKKRTS